MQKRAHLRGATEEEEGGEHVLRAFYAGAEPAEILAHYLRRPAPGLSFCRCVEQLAAGRWAGRPDGGSISDGEIVERARQMQRYLSGEDGKGRNPFAVLEVSETAGEGDIHRRFRILSKRVHPDRHGAENRAYWSARQREINEAYRALCDPPSRARWQAWLRLRRQLMRRLAAVEKAVSTK